MSLLWRIKSESYKKGTALSVLFNIISKGILFLLTIVIARYFGSNIKTDIYFFVFASMILFSGFINTIDSAVLIPESMRLREKYGDERAAAFLNFFLLIYVIIGILFTVVMYFFGPSVFGLISKFSKVDIHTYRNYFWIGSFFFVFHVLTNYLNTILTSLKFFSVPMVISSIKSCIAIGCIFLLKADYDVLSVFLGGLISYAFNLVILLILLKKVAGWKFFSVSTVIKKKVWGNIFYAEFGQVATVLSSIFPLYLLSGFGSGIISVMNYGKNIADIPNTLVTTQFANVSGIKLNEEIARQDNAAMNETFVSVTKMLVFILVPTGFFLFIFARPLVELFYLHGDFDATAVEGSAVFLQLLGVSVFSIAINAMVTRVFIAMQAMKQAFVYQIIMNVLLIIAIWLFVFYTGAYGYGYAMVVMNVINIGGMYITCRIIAPHINYAAITGFTAIVVLLNGIIATVIYYTVPYLQIGLMIKMIVFFVLWFFILVLIKKLLGLHFNIKNWLLNKQ